VETRSRPLRPRHRAEHFSQEEILEFIGIVINMNVWTRLKLAEGATPGLAEQTMSWTRSPAHGPRRPPSSARRSFGAVLMPPRPGRVTVVAFAIDVISAVAAVSPAVGD